MLIINILINFVVKLIILLILIVPIMKTFLSLMDTIFVLFMSVDNTP